MGYRKHENALTLIGWRMRMLSVHIMSEAKGRRSKYAEVAINLIGVGPLVDQVQGEDYMCPEVRLVRLVSTT